MGIVRTELTLTNLFTNVSLTLSALVDTGAMHMCITDAHARRLGFDPEEFSTQKITLADGRRLDVPKIRPIEIAFGDRTYATEALVFGDEALMGVLPLEAMDLVVDPGRRRIVANPQHPDYPVVLVKGAQ